MRLANIGNCRLHRLYNFWDSRRLADGRPMPRSALDPVALGPILTNVLLIEVAETAQQDYLPMMRFRVAGDEIESRYGRSLRGAALHETFPLVRRADTSHQWSEIVRDGRPKYRRGPMEFPDNRTFEAERLLLPLSCGERVTAFILGAIFYLPMPPDWKENDTFACTLDGR